MGHVLLTSKICGPECNILNNKNEGLKETLEDPLEQLKYILSYMLQVHPVTCLSDMF